MRNLSSQQTKKRWENYYRSLEDGNKNEAFSREFKKYTYTHTWNNSIRVIKKMTQLQNNDKVLDAGCGWGRILLGLIDDFTGLEITALDNQKEALKIGEAFIGDSKNGNTIKWKEGDLLSLPLPDQYFDKVYSARVFQHLNDPGKGVAEIIRVLKPGGRFVIFVQNKFCPLNISYYSRLNSPGAVRKWFRNISVNKLTIGTMDFCPSFLNSMTIESALEKIPGINKFGGKVVAWGEK